LMRPLAVLSHLPQLLLLRCSAELLLEG
jgi:hypothetical protein